MPKVSVIVPCYNSVKYLDRTLRSVARQSFTDWECLIMDDGSTDGTARIARRWAAADPRFSYRYKENSGPSDTRNKGVEAAAGEFILPLDSDDLISPDYMSLAMERFEREPRTTLVYCLARKFGATRGRWRLPEYSWEGILRANMIFCTAFFRRADFMACGGYNPNMRHAYEDWDLWLSLLDRDSVVLRLDRECFRYRIRRRSRNTASRDGAILGRTLAQLYLNHREKYEEAFPAPEAYAGMIAHWRSSDKEAKYRRLFGRMATLSAALLLIALVICALLFL